MITKITCLVCGKRYDVKEGQSVLTSIKNHEKNNCRGLIMSYTVKIQLCDDDSLIEEIETEVNDIEQARRCMDTLAQTLDDFIIKDFIPKG